MNGHYRATVTQILLNYFADVYCRAYGTTKFFEVPDLNGSAPRPVNILFVTTDTGQHA